MTNKAYKCITEVMFLNIPTYLNMNFEETIYY